MSRTGDRTNVKLTKNEHVTQAIDKTGEVFLLWPHVLCGVVFTNPADDYYYVGSLT